MIFYALDDKHVLALFRQGLRTCRRPAARPRAWPTARPVACATCELHAEAVFRVEGMDCHEEVVILERRLKPLAGLEAMSADVIGQRLHVKYDAAKLTTRHGRRGRPDRHADVARARGAARRPAPTSRGAAADRRRRRCAHRRRAGGRRGRARRCRLPLLLRRRRRSSAAIYPGPPRASTALRTRTVDINVLMVIAVAGALALGEWLEAASVVFLFALAQWLEVRTLERARQAIRALVDLSPREALVRRGGVEQRVAGRDDRGRRRRSSSGPATRCRSTASSSPATATSTRRRMTGESLPVDKAPGDEVYAGTINGRGALELASRGSGATRGWRASSTWSRRRRRSRAPVQSFVDRFARIYTPAVIALAARRGAGAAARRRAPMPATWLYRALVLLVIACPCALVISTPVSIVSALSAAARNGVLIKGGAHLERLAGVRVVAFDKTGTLTRGELQVDRRDRRSAPHRARDVLRFAAAVESRSEHPIARAIVGARAAQPASTCRAVSAFTSMPGHGRGGGRRRARACSSATTR